MDPNFWFTHLNKMGRMLAVGFLLGQLLLRTPADMPPAALAAPGKNNSEAVVTSIWGGARETIALKSDGTVWAWGVNDCLHIGKTTFGVGACSKLGDGTDISRAVPVRVHGPGNLGFLSDVTAIMGGEHANYALKSDGTLWAWGGNAVGQLGIGTYTNTVAPVQVSSLISVTMLGGRGYHNLAVTKDGKVWAWGWNQNGQLGHDTSGSPCPDPAYTGSCSNVPVQMNGISDPLMISGGGFFSLALMPDHTLRAWGRNDYGQLGNGTIDANGVFTPVQVSSVLSNVVQVSAGWVHVLALTSAGSVWAWGRNTSGEIGLGYASAQGIPLPVQVPGIHNAIAVSGGDQYSAVLLSDGTIWTWGKNQFGQLGDGTDINRATPAQVAGLDHVVYMAARDYHTVVVKSDGSVWAWGSGANGELGNGIFTDQTRPVQVILSPQFLFLPLILP